MVIDWNNSWVVGIVCGLLASGIVAIVVWYKQRNQNIYIVEIDPLIEGGKKALSHLPSSVYDELFEKITDSTFFGTENIRFALTSDPKEQLRGVGRILKDLESFNGGVKVAYLLFLLHCTASINMQRSNSDYMELQEDQIKAIGSIASELKRAHSIDILSAISDGDTKALLQSLTDSIGSGQLERVKLFNSIQDSFELKYSYEPGKEVVSIHPGKHPKDFKLSLAVAGPSDKEKLRELFLHGSEEPVNLDSLKLGNEVVNFLVGDVKGWQVETAPHEETREAALHIKVISTEFGTEREFHFKGECVKRGVKTSTYKVNYEGSGFGFQLVVENENGNLRMAPIFNLSEFFVGHANEELARALFSMGSELGEMQLRFFKSGSFVSEYKLPGGHSMYIGNPVMYEFIYKACVLCRRLNIEIPLPEQIRLKENLAVYELYPFASQVVEEWEDGGTVTFDLDSVADCIEHYSLMESGQIIKINKYVGEVEILGHRVEVPEIVRVFDSMVLNHSLEELKELEKEDGLKQVSFKMVGRKCIQYSMNDLDELKTN